MIGLWKIVTCLCISLSFFASTGVFATQDGRDGCDGTFNNVFEYLTRFDDLYSRLNPGDRESIDWVTMRNEIWNSWRLCHRDRSSLSYGSERYMALTSKLIRLECMSVWLYGRALDVLAQSPYWVSLGCEGQD